MSGERGFIVKFVTPVFLSDSRSITKIVQLCMFVLKRLKRLPILACFDATYM